MGPPTTSSGMMSRSRHNTDTPKIYPIGEISPMGMSKLQRAVCVMKCGRKSHLQLGDTSEGPRRIDRPFEVVFRKGLAFSRRQARNEVKILDDIGC